MTEGAIRLSGPGELDAIARAAVMQPYCGEVRIWGDEDFAAKLCVFEGRIAWVQCSRRAQHLGHMLANHANVTPWSLRLAMNYAAHESLNLGEALVELGILPLERLRSVLREHVQAHIAACFATHETLHARFFATPHRYDHALTFGYEDFEWGDASMRPRVVPSVSASPSLSKVCARAVTEVPGALAFGIVDRTTSSLLGFDGSELHDRTAIEEALKLIAADVMSRFDTIHSGGCAPPPRSLLLSRGGMHVAVRLSDDGTTGYILMTTDASPPGAAVAEVSRWARTIDDGGGSDPDPPHASAT